MGYSSELLKTFSLDASPYQCPNLSGMNKRLKHWRTLLCFIMAFHALPTIPADAAFKTTSMSSRAVHKFSPNSSSLVGQTPKNYAFWVGMGMGWGYDEFACLTELWRRESNWNHKALNKSSGAFGIPQSLPAYKMKAAGVDWRTNPLTQVRWGIDYISKRYSTPCRALNHSSTRGWY